MNTIVKILDWETRNYRREFWNFSFRQIETPWGVFIRNLDWDDHCGPGNSYYFMEKNEGIFLRIQDSEGNCGEIHENHVAGQVGFLDAWDSVSSWSVIG